MLGIYGGTFDPVHFGHLRPVLDVQQALKLEQVRFVPVGQPAHRQAPGANSQHRIKMLQLATETEDRFVVDDREITRHGDSYMVDTLLSFKQDFKQRSLCLIIGYDAFLGLTEWHQWERLITLANLVVTYRPGWNWKQHEDNVELNKLVLQHQCTLEQFKASSQGNLMFVPVTGLSISSTQIRQLIQRDESVSYLLPERVANYMQQHQLYR